MLIPIVTISKEISLSNRNKITIFTKVKYNIIPIGSSLPPLLSPSWFRFRKVGSQIGNSSEIIMLSQHGQIFSCRLLFFAFPVSICSTLLLPTLLASWWHLATPRVDG